MSPAPRCAPAPLLLLLLLLLLPGTAHGQCASLPDFRTCETTGEVSPPPYAVGTSVTYGCRPGYKAIEGKSLTIVCQSNSVWSDTSELCTAKECARHEVENGRLVNALDVTFGATISFTCNEGYRLIGVQSVKCVIKDSGVNWDNNFPICDVIPCNLPPGITNGTITNEAENYVFGTSITYKCNGDLSLVGNPSIHCTTKDKVNGVWSGPAPTCKAVHCSNPDIVNGKKTSGFQLHYSYNDAVVFECNPGYRIKGDNVVRCEANSTWVPPLPTCVSSPIIQAATTTRPSKGTKPASGNTGAATMVSVGSMPLMVAVLFITFHIYYLI